MTTATFETASEEETSAIGERLAAAMRPGDVIFLYGDLGAGKTAFVRGLARGVGAPEDEVSSPTFTLIQEYSAGEVVLYHVDLYRLAPAEVDDLGLDEITASEGIVAIEWPDRWHGRPAGAHEVRIEHRGDDRRSIAITLADTGAPGAGI
ncbi:MAG: tRNA (adenosine(37)-N6)-threonylcarbamoyltransferase complex ATPase subunit type 1 TsaE [Vicinamibacterales bacterium]